MARARNIKPGLYKNEDLAECSIWARYIFPGLWMLADREGRLEDRPKRIKAELLAFDTQDVSPLLDELQARGFLERYQNSDGAFIQICKFTTHQSPHYSEKESVIKPPQLPDSVPDDEPKKPEFSGELQKPLIIKRGSQPPDSLIPDSLIPDSLIPDSLIPESTPAPKRSAPKFDPASIPIPVGLILTKWGEWIAYRRSRRLTTAETTMRKQLEFLSQCQARGHPADAVIEASIANGWQGLFELKGIGHGKNRSSRADRVSATIAELTGANRHPSGVIEGVAERVD